MHAWNHTGVGKDGWVGARLDQHLGGDKAGTGMGTGLHQYHTGDETGTKLGSGWRPGLEQDHETV